MKKYLKFKITPTTKFGPLKFVIEEQKYFCGIIPYYKAIHTESKYSYPLRVLVNGCEAGCKINYINRVGIYCFNSNEQARNALNEIISYINEIQENKPITLTYILSDDTSLKQ